MATVDGNIVYPTYEIKKGVTWGNTLTFSGATTDISSIVFSLAFKRNGVTLITLADGVELVHTSTTVLTMKLTDEQTATLSSGAVTGDLLGTSGGNVTHFLTIATEVVS